MAVGKILNKSEEQRLVKLIGELERKTSGEIRIHIESKTSRHGILADATRIFKKLGMDKTKNRNGVLILVSIKNHELACIGDQGIHEKAKQEFWEETVKLLQSAFKKGDFFIGLHQAIERVGAVLSEHFPYKDGEENPNELSNEISS